MFSLSLSFSILIDRPRRNCHHSCSIFDDQPTTFDFIFEVSLVVLSNRFNESMPLREETAGQCAREGMKLASVQPLADIPSDPEAFRDIMLSRMAMVFDAFGGPQQYLDARYPSDACKRSFSTALVQFFPRAPGYESCWH